MDPVTIITTALVLGISAGLKDTAEQAIRDAYAGLKTLIVDRYQVALEGLEKKPDSEVQTAAVAEQLLDSKATEDAEVLEAAQKLRSLAEADPELRKQLAGVQIVLNSNRKFAFSYSGPATYTEK